MTRQWSGLEIWLPREEDKGKGRADSSEFRKRQSELSRAGVGAGRNLGWLPGFNIRHTQKGAAPINSWHLILGGAHLQAPASGLNSHKVPSLPTTLLSACNSIPATFIRQLLCAMNQGGFSLPHLREL